MKTITVAYWHKKFNELSYNHNQEFIYSIEQRNEIINDILEHGYSIMLRPSQDNLMIWIDNGRFGQK